MSEIVPVGKNTYDPIYGFDSFSGIYKGLDTEQASVLDKQLRTSRKKGVPLYSEESLGPTYQMLRDTGEASPNIGTKEFYKKNPLFGFKSWSLRELARGDAKAENIYNTIVHEGRHFGQHREGMRLIRKGQYVHPKLLKKDVFPTKPKKGTAAYRNWIDEEVQRALLPKSPYQPEMTTLIDIPKPKNARDNELTARLADALDGGDKNLRHLKYLGQNIEIEARVAALATGKGLPTKGVDAGNIRQTWSWRQLSEAGFDEKQIEKMVMEYKAKESIMYFHGSKSVYDDHWKATAKKRAKEQESLDKMSDEFTKKMKKDLGLSAK
mgnify:FL=1